MDDLSIIRGEKGGKKGGGVAKNADDTLKSKARALIVDALSEGPCVGIVGGEDGIFINRTPLSNIEECSYTERLGNPDDAPIPGFSSTSAFTGVGVAINHDLGPATRTVSDTTVDVVRVLMDLQYLYYVSKKGAMQACDGGWFIDIRPAGGSFTRAVTFDLEDEKCTAAVQFQHDIRLSNYGPGPWDVRVTARFGDRTDGRVYESIQWNGYAAITEGKFTYPHTGHVALSLSAEHVGSAMPDRRYRYKGRIVEVPTNYNPVTRVYTGVWDGTFKLAWTNNPAWVARDMVENDIFGIGADIPTDLMSKWKLYTIAQYCDGMVPSGYKNASGAMIMEPRYTFNGTIQNKQQALDAIRQMTTVWRGMGFYTLSQFHLTVDMPQDPAHVYSPANVVDGRFEYATSSVKARHSVVMVRFNDPNNFFDPAVEAVINDDLVQKFGWSEKSLELSGCSSRSLARRYGKWVLDSEQNETETVTFDVGLDSIHALPGDVIAINDPRRAEVRASGRITSFNAARTRAYTDAPIDPALVGPFKLWVQTKSGVMRSVNVASVSAARDYLGFTAGNANILTAETDPGAVFILVAANLVPREYRIVSIDENTDENTYKVTALQFDKTKFARVEQGILFDPLPTRVDALKIEPPTGLNFTRNTYVDGGRTRTDFEIGWTPPESPFGYRYAVEIDTPAQPSVPVTTTSLNSASYTTWDTGAYRVRVYAVNVAGRRSAPLEGSITVDGLTAIAVGEIQSLENAVQPGNAQFSGTDARIRWRNMMRVSSSALVPLVEDDVASYAYSTVKVYSGATLLRTHKVIGSEFTYTLNMNDADSKAAGFLGASRSLRFEVTLTDKEDRTSAASSLTLSNPVPAAVVAGATSQARNLNISWEPSNEQDVQGYLVWISTDTNVNPASTAPTQTVTGSTLTWTGAISTTYYVYVAAFDRFGKTGLNYGSKITVATGTDKFDTVAPAVPPRPTVTSTVEDFTATWAANTEEDFSFYEVAVATNGGNEVGFVTSTPNYTWPSKPNTPVTVRVRAVDVAGNRSNYSTLRSHTTANDTTAPAVPSTPTVTPGFGTLWFKWVANTETDFSHYEIYVASTTTNPVAGTAPTYTSKSAWLTLTGLAEALTQHFWVRAVDTSGNKSAWTARVQGTTSSIWQTQSDPAVPTGLALSSALDGAMAKVTATWTAAANNSSFELGITENGGNEVTVPVSGTRHTFRVLPNTSLSVRILGMNIVNKRSTWSAPATHTAAKDTVAPAVPTGLTPSPGFGTIWLKWNANSDTDLAFYEVYVSDTATAPVAGTAPSFISPGNTASLTGLGDTAVTRHVWVRAVDTSGNKSAWSGRVQATTTTVDVTLTTSKLSGLIDDTSFKSGFEPIKVVSALPTTKGPATISFQDELYRWDATTNAYVKTVKAADVIGTLVASQIAAKALDASKFADLVKPVEIVTALPGTPHVAGRMVFLTTDNKLYRNTGTGWTSATAAGDISGEIGENQIAAEAVTAAKIKAGVVGAGHLAAGSVTSSKIAVGDFTNLVPGSMLADAEAWKRLTGGATIDTVNRRIFCPAGTLNNLESEPFQVDPGAEYYLSLDAELLTGTTQSVRLDMIWINAAGGRSSTNGTRRTETVAGVVKNELVAVAPAGTLMGAWRAYVYENTNGDLAIHHPMVRRKNGGELIVDGAVTVGKLGAGAVDAEKIAAGAVDTDHLKANSITGAKIKAGEIATDHLAANIVTAAKMAVGDITNLVPDPELQDAGMWHASSNVVLNPTSAIAGAPSKGELVFSPGVNINAWNNKGSFVVTPGDKLFVSFHAYRNGGTKGNLRLSVTFQDAAGATVSGTIQATTVNNDPANQIFRYTGSGDVPAGAVRAKLSWYSFGSTTDAPVHAFSPTVRLMNKGELIVDGSIDANKVTTGELITLSGQIKDLVVTDGKIKDLDAGKIKANTILSETVVVGTGGPALSTVADGAGKGSTALGKFSGAGGTLPPGNVSFNFAGSSSKGGNASNTDNVGNQTAATVATTTLNFNSNNDRISAVPTSPAHAASPVSHSLNTDGSADILYQWTYTNTVGGAGDIDGFIVFVYSNTANTAYTITGTGANENPIYVTKDQRSVVLAGVSANKYFTVAVRAYRIVDTDINPAGVIMSPIVQVSSRYRPSATVAFAGDVTGSVGGTAAATVVSGAALGAQEPATRINAGEVKIEPGKIRIQGETTLLDWKTGGNKTTINGGAIEANTIAANKLTIGNRAITLTGIRFEHNNPGENQVAWTAGKVNYINDAGADSSVTIYASTSAGHDSVNKTWTSGVLYIYWTKGQWWTLNTTTDRSVAMAADNVILATYEGGIKLDADYGRTVIDGSEIKTDSITATQLVKTGTLITEVAQIKDQIVTNAKIVELDAGKLMASTALTGSLTVDGRNLGTIASPDSLVDTLAQPWIKNGGAAGNNLVLTAGAGEAGGNALVSSGTGWTQWYSPNKVPFNPSKMYRVAIRIKNVTNTGGNWYAGLRLTDANDTPVGINADGGGGERAWVIASNVGQSGIGSVFKEVVAYVKGADVAYVPNLRTIASPAKLPAATRFVQPIVQVNGGSTGSEIHIDSFSIEALTEESAELVNAGSVKINPGQILIQGTTSLQDWRGGADLTEINGGKIAANTVTANKMEIGSRGLTLAGLVFEHNKPGPNQLDWTAGTISYVSDTNAKTAKTIAAGNVTWASGVIYVYWVKDATTFTTTTNWNTATGSDRVIIATYEGGNKLSANIGRTIIDGGNIKTDSITASQLVKTAALITEDAQIGDAVITSAHITDLDAGKIKTGKMSAEFLTVDTLLTVNAENAGISVGRTSPFDTADGLYVGTDGAGAFGFSVGRTDPVSGTQQEVSLTTEGLFLSNMRFRVKNTGFPVKQSIVAPVTDQEIVLPANTVYISFDAIGGGGSGGYFASSYTGADGAAGQATVVRLYDGTTLKKTWTAAGGAGGVGPNISKYGGDGESSSRGNGGRGGDENDRSTANATGNGAGGGGGAWYNGSTSSGKGRLGGKKGKTTSASNYKLVGYTNPRLVVTVGAGAARIDSPYGGDNDGGAGSPGGFWLTHQAIGLIPANVLPLEPSHQGSLIKTGLEISFHDHGAGFWEIWTKGSNAANDLNIGYLEVDDTGALPLNIHATNYASFLSAKTPVRLGGGASGDRDIGYRFYKMSDWG